MLKESDNDGRVGVQAVAECESSLWLQVKTLLISHDEVGNFENPPNFFFYFTVLPNELLTFQSMMFYICFRFKLLYKYGPLSL